jgi:CheY-like chemotaxis protein
MLRFKRYTMDQTTHSHRFPQYDETILIVDDDDISRRLLSVMLKNMGFHSISVEDGQCVTFSCEYFSHIHAILMDMNMPKLDGYKTTRKIRDLYKKMNCNEYVPIIAVTGEENAEKCLRAGCDLHLLKPVSNESLADALQKVGLHPLPITKR